MKLNVKPPKNWFSEPWVKHILSTQSAFGILLTLPLPPALTTIHFCNNLLLSRISVHSASYIFVAMNLNCISHICFIISSCFTFEDTSVHFSLGEKSELRKHTKRLHDVMVPFSCHCGTFIITFNLCFTFYIKVSLFSNFLRAFFLSETLNVLII